MQEAERLGVDLLVATGYDEGGVIPAQRVGTFTIVPAMVDAVKIPVLAAGGINDSRGVQAVYALEASGVYVGTSFLVTKECRKAESLKQIVLTSKNEDVLLVAKQQRSLNTTIAQNLAKKYKEETPSAENEAVIRQMGGVRLGMLEGNLEDGIASFNTGIEVIRDIPSVAELIEQLMKG